MEWLILALAVCAAVGIVLYAWSRRPSLTDPMTLGGGTRLYGDGKPGRGPRPSPDRGGGTR